jgi:hypothetical protein
MNQGFNIYYWRPSTDGSTYMEAMGTVEVATRPVIFQVVMV